MLPSPNIPIREKGDIKEKISEMMEIRNIIRPDFPFTAATASFFTDRKIEAVIPALIPVKIF